MTTFKEQYLKLKEKQEELNQEKRSLYMHAVREVQAIIDDMQIKAGDLRFFEDGKKPRAPARIKYATPDGSITWTGKGAVKKELQAWLDANNKTLEDVAV